MFTAPLHITFMMIYLQFVILNLSHVGTQGHQSSCVVIYGWSLYFDLIQVNPHIFMMVSTRKISKHVICLPQIVIPTT